MRLDDRRCQDIISECWSQGKKIQSWKSNNKGKAKAAIKALEGELLCLQNMDASSSDLQSPGGYIKNTDT